MEFYNLYVKQQKKCVQNLNNSFKIYSSDKKAYILIKMILWLNKELKMPINLLMKLIDFLHVYQELVEQVKKGVFKTCVNNPVKN